MHRLRLRADRTTATLAAMGRNYGWTAIRDASVDEVIDGIRCERTTGADVTLGICELPNGWILIDSSGYPFFGASQLRRLSTGREVLVFDASEFVMADSLVCYRDGAQAWRVENDPDEPGEIFFDDEDVPHVLEQIECAKERLVVELSETDFADDPLQAFDVIQLVAEQLAGYNVDNANHGLRWVHVAPTDKRLTS